MKAYVINLDTRTDRMEELDIPLQFTRWKAVDGKTIEDAPNKLRGHIGCLRSHITLLEHIKESGDDCAIVFEDDVEVVPGFEERLAEAMASLPANWDLLYLGGWNKLRTKKYNRLLNVAEVVYCTHAYVVRAKFIDRILRQLRSRDWKVDVLLSEVLGLGKCYICNPVLAWQRAGYSDIVNGVTDNKHLR